MENTGNRKKLNRNNESGMQFKVVEKGELMTFLIQQMPHKSRNNIKSFLTNKQVLVDGKAISQYNHIVLPGQSIEIGRDRIPQEKSFLEYTIVFEDRDLIVIEKQAGLLSMATETEKRKTAYSLLSDHVKKQHPSNKIFIVHRLDRETSGLMVFAKSEDVKLKLQETWIDSVVERTYIALVEGILKETSGTIISWLYEDKNFMVHSSPNPGPGQKAITHFEVIKEAGDYSLLKLNLETGRKNQIRVHMQDIGHSVTGDKKYGAKTNPVKRLGLHAQSLSFMHPVTNERLTFETKIPKAFLRMF